MTGELSSETQTVEEATQYNVMLLCFDQDGNENVRLYNYTFHHKVPTIEDIREVEKAYAEVEPELETVKCAAFNLVYAQ